MTPKLPQATFTPIDDNPNRLEITGELATVLHEMHPQCAASDPVVLKLSSETFYETGWTHELLWSMTVYIGDVEIWNAEIGVASSSATISTTTVPRFVNWCAEMGELHAEMTA